MLNRILPLSQWIGISLVGVLIFFLVLIRFHRLKPVPTERSPAPVVCEVQGEGIVQPGVHLLEGAVVTVLQALEAAGGCRSRSPEEFPEEVSRKEIHTGQMIRVICQGADTASVRIEPMRAAARLTLGMKLDVNSSTEEELLLIPGMKPDFAGAIVQRRHRRLWQSLRELTEISGVGPKTVEKWENYLEILTLHP